MKTLILFVLMCAPILSEAAESGRFWVQDGVTLVLARRLQIPSGRTTVPGFLGDHRCSLEANSPVPVTLPAGEKLKGQLFASDRLVSKNYITLERHALTGFQFFPAGTRVQLRAFCASDSQFGDPGRQVPSFAEFLRRAAGTFRLKL